MKWSKPESTTNFRCVAVFPTSNSSDCNVPSTSSNSEIYHIEQVIHASTNNYIQVLKSKITVQVGNIMVYTKAINGLNVTAIILYYVYLFLLVLQSHQVHAGRFSLFLAFELKF